MGLDDDGCDDDDDGCDDDNDGNLTEWEANVHLCRNSFVCSIQLASVPAESIMTDISFYKHISREKRVNNLQTTLVRNYNSLTHSHRGITV